MKDKDKNKDKGQYYGKRQQVYIDWNPILAWVVLIAWITIVTWGVAKEITRDEENMRRHDKRNHPEHAIPVWH